ncbi:GNAT family N-acetyltransferase [Natronospora cellulosivora (SeqCode)]
MKEIINRANQLKYSSLKYLEKEDIANLDLYINKNDSIFFYSIISDTAKVDWAANTKSVFLNGLRDLIDKLRENKTINKVHIEFIPPEFVSDMEKEGFIIVSEWIDFWYNNLEEKDIQLADNLTIREIKDNEYESAALVTQSCKDFSRGYTGETSEWIKDWNGNDDSIVFLAEKEKSIVGVCCANLYGFDREDGPIMWLRELAVHPEYHSQKIGLNLMSYAIKWGITKGAKRSFLACDEDNKKAIKLYEGIGYQRNSERGQINMESNSLLNIN